MIIDTHCHYNLKPLFFGQESDEKSWQKHWQKAQSLGVTHSLVVGTNLKTSQIAIDLAVQEPNFRATAGIHPGEYTAKTPDLAAEKTQLAKLLTSSPDLAAVGEVGLDYFRLSDTEASDQIKQLQRRAFISQIELANQHQLPLILHVRDQHSPDNPTAGNAYWDVLELMRTHHSAKTPVILHCVSGPLAYITAMLQEFDAYIGVAGNVSYPSAHPIREAVKLAPTERILLETDAPFLPPQQYRGQMCEPWMIERTDEYLGLQLGIDLEQVYRNSLELFNFSQ